LGAAIVRLVHSAWEGEMSDVADLSVQDCARILLASTRDWQAADGKPATLANVRTALARLIYALGGQGFPDPASDALVQDRPEIWTDCFAAARDARDAGDKPLPPEGRYAVLWSPDPDTDGKIAPGLGLNWPYQPTSHVARIFGPVIDSDHRAKQLFMFESIDENAGVDVDLRPAPGLWPKPAAPVAPIPLVTDPDPAATARPSQQRLGLATLMFLLWGLSYVYIGAWQWIQGDIAQRSWTAFQAKITAASAGDELKSAASSPTRNSPGCRPAIRRGMRRAARKSCRTTPGRTASTTRCSAISGPTRMPRCCARSSGRCSRPAC
jgi:hypothetical protein